MVRAPWSRRLASGTKKRPYTIETSFWGIISDLDRNADGGTEKGAALGPLIGAWGVCL